MNNKPLVSTTVHAAAVEVVNNNFLRDMTNQEIYDALKKAGPDPNSHFIKRLAQERISALGRKTLADFDQVPWNGVAEASREP